jgi:ABC-type branched-subunit amino acid transport system substrate-binding protein
MRKTYIATASLSFALLASPVFADDVIRIGVLATLKGAHTVLGEDAVRGVKVALEAQGNEIAGKTIELLIEPVSNTPESTLEGTQNLLAKDTRIILGPVSSAQGISLKEFSKTQPGATFINGISGAVETTFVNPSENFFRFNTDNLQWSAGLGDYAFNAKDYKKVAIVAEDYSFNHAQVMGFEKEFCSAGGEVVNRAWLELGVRDFSKTVETIPDDIDAVYLGLSGSSATRFVKTFNASGRKAGFIGSSITFDGALIGANEKVKSSLVGMVSAGPQADNWGNENWQAYVSKYKDLFSPEERFTAPSILATGYHNAATAALTCIADVDADLSDNHAAFRQCLSGLEFEAPNGPVKLDENRQAIANNYVSEIVQQGDGSIAKKLVSIAQNVDQTLGLGQEAFAKLGLPSRDNRVCE